MVVYDSLKKYHLMGGATWRPQELDDRLKATVEKAEERLGGLLLANTSSFPILNSSS